MTRIVAESFEGVFGLLPSRLDCVAALAPGTLIHETKAKAEPAENTMQIQINTDHHIEVHEELAAHLRASVEAALSHFSEQITRVEMHLSDENADKRCLLEARLKGRQPIAVTHESESLGQAVDGAADKLARSIKSALGRAARTTAAEEWTEPTEPE